MAPCFSLTLLLWPAYCFSLTPPALTSCFSLTPRALAHCFSLTPCSGPLSQFDNPALALLLFQLDTPALAPCLFDTPALAPCLFDTPALAPCFILTPLLWSAYCFSLTPLALTSCFSLTPCSGPLSQFDTPALAPFLSMTPLLWSAYCFSLTPLDLTRCCSLTPLAVARYFSWTPLPYIYLLNQQNSEKFNQSTPVTFKLYFAEQWFSEGDIWEFRKNIAFQTKLASITLSLSNYVFLDPPPPEFVIAAAIYLHCK